MLSKIKFLRLMRRGSIYIVFCSDGFRSLLCQCLVLNSEVHKFLYIADASLAVMFCMNHMHELHEVEYLLESLLDFSMSH